MDKVKSRKEYADGTVGHRQYYAQFVGEKIKQLVLREIGIERILKSTDEHMNDIPLKLWDNIAGAMCRGLEVIWFNAGAISPYMEISFKEVGDSYSLANAVCVLKEGAKQIKESKK